MPQAQRSTSAYLDLGREWLERRRAQEGRQAAVEDGFDPIAELRAVGIHVWDRCDGGCEDRCGGWEPIGAGFGPEHGRVATQGDMIRAAFDPDVDEVYVHGSFGTGKNFGMAAVACLSLKHFRPSVFLDTSSGHRQVRRHHWGEVNALAHIIAPELPRPGVNKWEIDRQAKHYAEGFSTDTEAAAKGYHGARVTLLINEADGVPLFVFTGGERILTGEHDRLICLTNTVYEDSVTCDRLREGRGLHLRLDATDFLEYQRLHPSQKFPGAASPKWLRKMQDTYGEESLDYRIAVHALYPEGDQSRLFPPRKLAEAEAVYRHRLATQEFCHLVDGSLEPVVPPDQVGADVAGFGRDRTCWAGRWDQRFIALLKIEAQTDQAKHRLEIQQQQERWPSGHWTLDRVGIGEGTERELVHAGFPLDGFAGGEKADDQFHYDDRITEALFALRDYIEAGGALPPNDRLRKQLVAVEVEMVERDDPSAENLRKKVLEREKVVVKRVSMKKWKKACRHSPDEAYAAAMACAPAKHVTLGPRAPAAVVETMGSDEVYDDGAAGGSIQDADF